MNAGRDVERLIADWLAEEAAVRSPDRMLVEARRTVLTTPQRRLAARWREPVFISPFRLTTMAAALVVAVVGGAWVGRVTAPTGVGAPNTSPAPSASTAAAVPTLAEYRSARDAICDGYTLQLDPLKPKTEGVTEPGTPASQRASATQALTELVGLSEAMTAELHALAPPPSLAEAHIVDVTNYRQVNALIRNMLSRLAAADYAGAKALDLATNPLSGDIRTFETANGLRHCP